MSQTYAQSYQRTLFLFQDEKELNSVLLEFFQHCLERMRMDPAGLFVIDDQKSQSVISQSLKAYLPKLKNVRKITFDDVFTVLGQTVDFLLIDLREEFIPNKINILLETVRGGGIIFILGLPYSEWVYSVNKNRFVQGEMLLPSAKRMKSVLLGWFLENIQKNSRCRTKDTSSSKVISEFNPMPYKINLKSQINSIAVTPEQKNVINSMTRIILNSKHPNSCSVLLANRGRGKSASIGLILSQVLSERGKQLYKVIISSPHPMNVQTLFNFLSRGLLSKNIRFHIIKQEGLISGIHTSRAKINYLWPSEIDNNLKTDLFVLDEAAAIPVDILKDTVKIKSKKIFVSTIHGYEGAGRGFQYKFLHYLQTQKQIRYDEFSLSQPIRFLSDDLIEELLNQSFLLNIDLESSKIDHQFLDRESFNLQVYEDPVYLFSEKGLPQLKQLFGLLVYSHYRNQPNDLLVLTDSGKHFLTGMYGKDSQNTTQLLVSNQLAKEGEMTDQEILRVTSGDFIQGNLISTIGIRHFSKELAKLRGLRIARIATHPSLMDKGFGRIAIELQNQLFSTYDWIGVSFGATVKLMKFWKKFDFKAVHIRPIKTPETGEWNIVVISPLSPSAKTIVNQASADFLLQFIALLNQSLYSMKPELVLQIIKTCNPIPNYEPPITSSGVYRLKNYLKGQINFLLAVDVIYELSIEYFVSSNVKKLSSSQELLLIARVLQGRTWGQTLSKTGLNWKAANRLLEKAVAKIAQDHI
ncbi:MAG: GNAT family N-acetyltransferase [Promethearchaeota archaeon]